MVPTDAKGINRQEFAGCGLVFSLRSLRSLWLIGPVKRAVDLTAESAKSTKRMSLQLGLLFAVSAFFVVDWSGEAVDLTASEFAVGSAVSAFFVVDWSGEAGSRFNRRERKEHKEDDLQFAVGGLLFAVSAFFVVDWSGESGQSEFAVGSSLCGLCVLCG